MTENKGAEKHMEKMLLFRRLGELYKNCEGNVVPDETALEGCGGLVLFGEPVFGVSSADDPLYAEYKKARAIGDRFMAPAEWLPGAKSVLSFFLPFTDRVCVSNCGDPGTTSPEWLHARIEGQAFLNGFALKIKEYFESRGIPACAPSLDERFGIVFEELPENDPEGLHVNSRWSERHAAYASGLGTFCLSKGLISSRGVAGRYGSVIVSEEIEPDERPYKGIYEYCIRCGACIARCPANAISLEHGKNQRLCHGWLEQSKKRYAPRYGCGKCQVGVPCEKEIPKRIVRP